MLGQRAELKPERQRLTIESEALRDKCRSLLPLHEDVMKIDRVQFMAAAGALCASLSELLEIQRKIDILTRELGGE